jgi:putative addiction module CopG family antidote
MRTTKQLSITLPTGMAEEVHRRVASGEYASESEVVRDGLRALSSRDHAIQSWLHTEVAAAYDELKAAPSRGIPAQQIRDQLAKLHESRVRGNGS